MFNWRISTDLPRCFNLLQSMPTTYVHLPYFWVITDRITKTCQIQSGIQSHQNFSAANIEIPLTFDRTSWQELVWSAVETRASHLEGFPYNTSCKFYNKNQLVTNFLWRNTCATLHKPCDRSTILSDFMIGFQFFVTKKKVAGRPKRYFRSLISINTTEECFFKQVSFLYDCQSESICHCHLKSKK